QVLDQGLQPGAVDTSAVAVHQQRRAHLHDDSPCLREGRCRIRTPGVHEGKLYAIELRCPTRPQPLHLVGAERMTRVAFAVSRDYEPVPSHTYQNGEEGEAFRVLPVDEDSEHVDVECDGGGIE